MPVPSADFKKAIKQLSDKEKETLLLRAVRRDAELYDLFSYELLPDITLEQLTTETSEKIHDLMYGLTGRNLTKSITRSLRKSTKEIARFKRITKDVKAEIDLHIYLLRLIFDNFTGQFESRFKSFFVATARLVLRTMQLIRKNLHEDYHIEYKTDLDDFLQQLNSRSKSNQLSFTLPQTFEVD
ncbi:hypothetical protein [Adhaeribacter aquaticus]|uniref:hypothetical protein n=1 Tax=Adhaeribacter aquaticus TaxID=299567 RepID=UPI000411DBA6|nr:hypothetical protein [Adhaeribacter aquaticus]